MIQKNLFKRNTISNGYQPLALNFNSRKRFKTLECSNSLPGHQWQSTLFSTSWPLKKSKLLQEACLSMALVAVAQTHFSLDLNKAYSFFIGTKLRF